MYDDLPHASNLTTISKYSAGMTQFVIYKPYKENNNSNCSEFKNNMRLCLSRLMTM